MLQDVSAVADCIDIELLDLHGCQMLECLPMLSRLSRLESIDISSCPEIESLDFMLPEGCPALKSLRIGETAIEDSSLLLQYCGNLETLNLWGEDIDVAFAAHLLRINPNPEVEVTTPKPPWVVSPGTHSPAAAMAIHEWFMSEEDPDLRLI